MKGTPMVLWTCDKCDWSQQCRAESQPPGWRRVISHDLSSRDLVRSQADWCRQCVEKYLPALDRAEAAS